MVHRDIKPSNLVLAHQRNQAVIKVLRFRVGEGDPRGPRRWDADA